MRVLFEGTGKTLDVIPVGRVAIDFNPTDMNRPLSESANFNKYLGGSPANIAVGMARYGRRVGFLGKVSDDSFGDFVTDYFRNEGIDCSHITRCKNGEKLGLDDRLQVINAEFRMALTAMKTQGKTVDLVFLDPPYASGYAAEAVEILFREALLKPGGTVIVDHAWDQPPKLGEGPWQIARVKKYGACGVTTLTGRERE